MDNGTKLQRLVTAEKETASWKQEAA